MTSTKLRSMYTQATTCDIFAQLEQILQTNLSTRNWDLWCPPHLLCLNLHPTVKSDFDLLWLALDLISWHLACLGSMRQLSFSCLGLLCVMWGSSYWNTAHTIIRNQGDKGGQQGLEWTSVKVLQAMRVKVTDSCMLVFMHFHASVVDGDSADVLSAISIVTVSLLSMLPSMLASLACLTHSMEFWRGYSLSWMAFKKVERIQSMILAHIPVVS